MLPVRTCVPVPALMKRIADDVWIENQLDSYSDPRAGGKGAALEALKKLEPGFQLHRGTEINELRSRAADA